MVRTEGSHFIIYSLEAYLKVVSCVFDHLTVLSHDLLSKSGSVP